MPDKMIDSYRDLVREFYNLDSSKYTLSALKQMEEALSLFGRGLSWLDLDESGKTDARQIWKK